MKRKWSTPKVVPMDRYAEALGTCEGGSSATETSCANGESTVVQGDTEMPHGCFDGGYAGMSGGCQTGSTELPAPKACYDGLMVE